MRRRLRRSRATGHHNLTAENQKKRQQGAFHEGHCALGHQCDLLTGLGGIRMDFGSHHAPCARSEAHQHDLPRTELGQPKRRSVSMCTKMSSVPRRASKNQNPCAV